MVDGGTGAAWTTAIVEEATAVATKEAIEEREKASKFKRAPIKMMMTDPEHS